MLPTVIVFVDQPGMSVEGPPHLVTEPGADPAEATDRIAARSAGGHHRRPESQEGTVPWRSGRR